MHPMQIPQNATASMAPPKNIILTGMILTLAQSFKHHSPKKEAFRKERLFCVKCVSQ